MNDRSPTVGVLFPGDMGAAVASLLQSRGMRVVTTLEGRGDRTARRCQENGLIVLDSFQAVAQQSNIVISLVPPDSAEAVAVRYAGFAAIAPAHPLFVDANSIRPERMTAMARTFEAAGIDFVDASINGLAKNLARAGTLFLSGVRAEEIADLFGDAMRVKILGAAPGRASAMKMLLGGLSKGMCALFLELAIVAQRTGMLSDLLEATALIYPGMSALADRMLPTYAKHAPRRAVEMGELEAMTRSAGLEPCVIEAIHRLHELLATVNFNPATPEGTAGDLIEQLASNPCYAARTQVAPS